MGKLSLTWLLHLVNLRNLSAHLHSALGDLISLLNIKTCAQPDES